MALIVTSMVFVAYAGPGRYAEVTTVFKEKRFMRPAIDNDVIANGCVTTGWQDLAIWSANTQHGW